MYSKKDLSAYRRYTENYRITCQGSEEKSMTDDKEAFNAFTADWKNRIETLIKTVLLLSGGVMSITIGAYINANPPKFR